MEATELVKSLGSWAGGNGPLYRQLARAVQEAITRGDVVSGSALPPERMFAAALAVSRSTVVSAYDMLREEEWVESRQGSGTRVCEGVTAPRLPRRELAARRSARTGLLDLAMPSPVDVIDLSRGTPAIPAGLYAEDFALSVEEMAVILQGDAYQAQGSPALRRAIAERYTREGTPTNESQILITSGAQQAISLLAALYLQRGDSVVLENPTYVGAIDAFRAAGARLISAPIEQDGPRIDVLRGLATASFPQLMYLVPTFQNPTGVMASTPQRIALAHLAAETNVPLIADDTLADLALDEKAPPTLAHFDRGGTIITIGSLSKLFWGGLRIGWIRAPEALISRLTRVRVGADLGSSPITQAIAVRLMPRVDDIMAMRCKELKPHLDLLCRSLQELLPSWRWTKPAGGIFLWAQLPAGDAREFAQVALRCGVMITPGSTMSADESHTNFVRIAFLQPTENLRTGVERMAQAWDSYISRPALTAPIVEIMV